jgi:hypothetical protein
MAGYTIVPRDQWGGNEATQAISAWRQAEEGKAQRLLQERSWLAQQALLRGDIDRYTGLTGITPQTYNPNYDPELDKKIEQSVLSAAKSNLSRETKGSAGGADAAATGAGLGRGSSEVLGQSLQKYNKNLEKEFDNIVSKNSDKIQAARNNNPEFLKGREFGKAYNNMYKGAMYDIKKGMPIEQVIMKYGPQIGSAMTSWARPGNPYAGLMGFRKVGAPSGGSLKPATVRVGNERSARAVDVWPNQSMDDVAKTLINRYPDLKETYKNDHKALAARLKEFTQSPYIQSAEKSMDNEAANSGYTQGQQDILTRQGEMVDIYKQANLAGDIIQGVSRGGQSNSNIGFDLTDPRSYK